MLDLQFICDHVAEVTENCRNRGVEADIEKIVRLRQRRGELITAGDGLRHDHKESSSKIPQESDPQQKQALIAKGKELKGLIAANEEELRELESELRAEQSLVPNMTHPDAPVGGDDDANRIVRQVGEIPQFDFPVLNHVELADKHDLIDLEAGSRVAGHGFYYLKNEAVLLEMALIQLALQKVAAAGFTLHTTPDLARDSVLEGIGFSPRGPETQIYSVEQTDLSLVATAEITLGGMYKDQIVDAAQLPIKIAGISHCFRTEAGAHGQRHEGSIACINSPKSKCSPSPLRINPIRCTRRSWQWKRISFRLWVFPIKWSIPPPAIWADRPIASTTSKPGCRDVVRGALLEKSPQLRIALIIRRGVWGSVTRVRM